jgi:uncharacterized protein
LRLSRFYWTQPSLEVSDAGPCGKGVFATTHLDRGTVLVVLGGEIIAATDEHGDHGVQITESLVLAAPSSADIGVPDLLNHSCDPNSGFLGQIMLVALRPITQHEQVTFDYAMCLYPVEGLARYELHCSCGSPLCRGLVTEDDWQNPTLQDKYRGHFQPFLQRIIDRDRRDTPTSPATEISGRCQIR